MPTTRGRELFAIVESPFGGHLASAPPLSMANPTNSDFCCGHCGAVLMRAEGRPISGLMIECTWCNSCNSSDGFSD
jgi:hypothetical protein